MELTPWQKKEKTGRLLLEKTAISGLNPLRDPDRWRLWGLF